jgi:hypothetical protein
MFGSWCKKPMYLVYYMYPIVFFKSDIEKLEIESHLQIPSFYPSLNSILSCIANL